MLSLSSPEFFADFDIYGGVNALYKYLSLDYSNNVLLLACVAVGYMNEHYALPLKSLFFQALTLEARVDAAIIIQATRILINLAPFTSDTAYNGHLVKRFVPILMYYLD